MVLPGEDDEEERVEQWAIRELKGLTGLNALANDALCNRVSVTSLLIDVQILMVPVGMSLHEKVTLRKKRS